MDPVDTARVETADRVSGGLLDAVGDAAREILP
jgi:hypothetical protein